MPQLQEKTPNWDMTQFFPEFDGPDYTAYRDGYRQAIADTQRRAAGLGVPSLDNLDSWVELLQQWEKLFVQSSHLNSYLECLRAADARHEGVAREYSGMALVASEQKKVDVLIQDGLRACSDELFSRLLGRPELQGAGWHLQRMRTQAQHLMGRELETLAADLEVDGLAGWSRLYDQISGKLEFDMPDGRVPMALKVSMLESPDAQVRRDVLVNSNREWERMEDVTAACLNGIAGTRLTLYRNRGIEDFLDPPLFEGAISRATLEAMFEAIASRYEVPRRYLRLKARLLGLPRLGFQDLSAPLPLGGPEKIGWEQAKRRIEDAFGRRYPELAEFAGMAFERRWIDYEPRAGKRQGGFCTVSEDIAQSRIFMTFNQTTGDVQTLAHELGHAFHSWLMKDLRPWARIYPMTLAETASTFAETLYTDALLESPEVSERQKAVVLDTRLDAGAAFLLNIPMRFLFEKRFYQQRKAGEVPVSRFKELLLDAQRECYGDTLAPDQLDAYFWASKLHFYIGEVSFYNFPYSFGFLFSLGVYARARQEGPQFMRRYEELLRLTGSDSAENLARRTLGVDLEKPDFWLESIRVVESDLARFEELAPRVVAASAG